MGSGRSSHEGSVRLGAALAFDPYPGRPWEVVGGDRVVLVLYSSSKPNPASFDRQIGNDELVVELPSLESGATIDLTGRVARYQRGSAALTYVSKTVTGTVQITSYNGKKLVGSAHIEASQPELDTLGQGAIQQELTFNVRVKTV